MNDQKIILQLAKKQGRITTEQMARLFQISRQAAHRKLHELWKVGKLKKIGQTRSTFYTLPEKALSFQQQMKITFRVKNHKLEEHVILDRIQKKIPEFFEISENVRSIFSYAFLEMLNNAIEHSQSPTITIQVVFTKTHLQFVIRDYGIGVFFSVQAKLHLKNAWEAIQELLKGKTTTAPKLHSGEGIFFTSKIADLFLLDSDRYLLCIDNDIHRPDLSVEGPKKKLKGTEVTFQVALHSKKHLIDLFQEYAPEQNDYGFTKTKIHVQLFTYGTVHISRSQARRLLVNLEKFKHIVLDFNNVPSIGQAFADEIFRVFQQQHPQSTIEAIHTNEATQFMINRVLHSA